MVELEPLHIVGKRSILVPNDHYVVQNFRNLHFKAIPLRDSNGVRRGNEHIVYAPALMEQIVFNKDYLKKLAVIYKEGTNSMISFACENGKDIVILKEYSLASLARLINYYIKNNLIEIDEEKGKYINRILHAVNPKPLIRDIKNKTFNIVIDGKGYEVSVKDIFKLFLEDYKLLNNLYDVDTYNSFNINPRKFIYAAMMYAKKTKLFNRFMFDEGSELFYKRLINNDFIDFYAYNTIIKTEDPFTQGINLNEELVDYVLKDMPREYDALKKSIYVYIKLCKLFDYAPGYYASYNGGRAFEYHENILHLEEITPTNREVVCYEFSAVFARFLARFGIDYVYRCYNMDYYGADHTFINYRVGDMIVSANGIDGYLYNDMYYAKIGGCLEGLSCMNINIDTNEKFDDTYNDVYLEIVRQDKHQKSYQHPFNQTLLMYRSQMESGKVFIPIEEKIDILKTQMSGIELPKMSTIAYLKQLASILFKEQESNRTFNFSIVYEKVDSDMTDKMPLVVLQFKEPKDRERGIYTIRYLTYNSMGEFVEVDKKEINKRFKNGECGPIHNFARHEVWGIEREK